MAVDWIQNQGKKTSSHAINVDSKAALLAIANKHTTHPLAVATRLKTIELRNSTSIIFYWVKGHAGLKGNERADYLAKTSASYITTIAYDAIPIIRGKQSLEDYYTKIWNAIYVNSANASHTKLQVIHTHHLPQTFPFPLAQRLSHSIPIKSWQLPFISPQHKQDALTKLQLSGKDYTNGPSPYDRMQLILKLPTSSTQISSPTSGSEAPHKYS